MKKKLIGAAIAIILIIAGICAVVFSGEDSPIKDVIKNNNSKATTTTASENKKTDTKKAKKDDKHKGEAKSKLTGLYVSEKKAAKRPVAVMINNISDALPQSGVSGADVIYECPVEGGITRMMALFEDYKGLDKIGSIRSSRIYYCYFALEWDAIYCHFGQSKYALDLLKSDQIDNICAFNTPNDFYQTSDRVAPHNTYIGADGIDNAIKSMNYRRNYKDDYKAHFKFAEEGKENNLKNGEKAAKVEIGYAHNHPYYTYDKKQKVYKRFQREDKQIDAENNKQLECKNIIIQFVDNTMYDDGKSLNITLTGSGNGYYITNGKAVEITWKKDSLKDKTKYVDELNPGKTWINVVQNSTSVTISE